MKTMARIAAYLPVDGEDLEQIARWGIMLLLAVIAIFVVAGAGGLAVRLFEVSRGLG